MTGYIKIRIMSAGQYFDCWQQIENGQVVGYVDGAGQPVTLPGVHESFVLNATLLDAPEA